jgi:hypothetical protein
VTPLEVIVPGTGAVELIGFNPRFAGPLGDDPPPIPARHAGAHVAVP